MLVKLTLQRPGEATGEDLLVEADPAATVAQLAGAVSQRDPRSRSRAKGGDANLTFRVEGSGDARVLDPDQALADAMLRSGDRVVLQSADGTHFDAADQRATAAVLVVAEGPGEGTRFPLRHGANQAGRAAGSDVVLDDPMVSKRHARFNVTDVVEVIDLGSVNGVFIGGQQVERAVLRTGDRVLLGDSTLVLESLRTDRGHGQSGPVEAYNRSPYLDPIYHGETIKAPEPPARPQPPRFPIIAMLAPLIFAIVLFAITRNVLSIVFMGLSPVMIAGTWLESRRVMKATIKEAIRQYGEALDHLDQTLTSIQVEEAEARRRETPGTAKVVEAAQRRESPLWARRPDRHGFLDVRLGRAAMPTRTVVEMPQTNNTIAELWDRLHEVVGRHRLVDDVPVVGSFADAGVIGVSGALDHALGSARAIVGQVASLHSPAEVVVAGVFSAEAASDWDWIKWLPHTTSDASPIGGPLLASGASGSLALLAQMRELIDQRSGEAGPDGAQSVPEPAVVVVVDDQVPVARSVLVEIAERGPNVGVYTVWVARTIDRLPAAAEVFIDHDPSSHHVFAGYIDGGRVVVPVTAEPLDGTGALALAKSLAPVVDAGASANELNDLPGRVSFVEELGLDLLDGADAVVDRWRLSDSLPSTDTVPHRRKAAPLNALVGVGPQGPLQLDLRAQGPHALVGGTTGAGKSEFLQSWILGLATTHSPARVTFLLVDYKGGAAFSECVKLPHTVGLVTDLTPHLVQRALKSLDAELRHRERILSRKKAKDVLELEQRHDPECPPSLVIVVDEFAALVMEVPEFVDGVVNVAQRGRSLGLHLVLATQRPTGVIKDNLRANTNLRVALRMADDADSADVIGTAVAATFDPALPGRAVAKTGPGRLDPFQAAYLGGWTTGEPPEPLITLASFSLGGLHEWPEPEGEAVEDADPGPTDIERLVGNVADASSRAEIPSPRRPWLPALASSYDIARPPENEDDIRLLSRTDERLVFGVLDDPAEQAQVPVAFEPDHDGNMAVIGTGGAGKSALLRTLAVAASLSTRGGPCHVYGLDFASRGLDMLLPLPNVGAVITSDDEERTVRLLRMLRTTIDERLDRYSSVKADTIASYRAAAGRPDEARILLLVDGFPSFRNEYDGVGRLRVYETFQSIASDGRQVGVHVVIAADRTGAVPSAMSSLIQKWLILRLAGDNEYAMAGVDPDVFPAGSPPGRGWFDEHEIQVGVLGSANDPERVGPTNAEQAAAISRLALLGRKRGTPIAPEVGSLPEYVTLDSLPKLADGLPVVGVADNSLGPFAIPWEDPVVVVGPPKSGKTTALISMVASIGRSYGACPLVYVGEGRSHLAGAFPWDRAVLGGDDARESIEKLNAEWSARRRSPGRSVDGSALAGPAAILVLDDLPRLNAWAEADLIAELLGHVQAAGGMVVGDGETASMGGTYGLPQAVKVSRTGLLLQPDQFDGDNILKTPLPKFNRAGFTPGRGFFVHAGKVQKLHVATSAEATE